jgi:hypothetical protein
MNISLPLFLLVTAATLFAEKPVEEDAAEEARQRAEEMAILQRVTEFESIKPIPEKYLSEKRPFLILEGTHPLYPDMVVYRFGNSSKKVIYFIGEKPARPLRKYQELRNGNWVAAEPALYCGTGLGVRALKPGESVLLGALKADAPNRRSGVELLSGKDNPSVLTTIWSQ